MFEYFYPKPLGNKIFDQYSNVHETTNYKVGPHQLYM